MHTLCSSCINNSQRGAQNHIGIPVCDGCMKNEAFLNVFFKQHVGLYAVMDSNNT
jgi:hypothetical protein